MKALLFTISLSLSFIVVCACTFLGVRMSAALWRGLIVFVLAYAGGLVAALIIFVSYLSKDQQKPPNFAYVPKSGPAIKESIHEGEENTEQ